jgi:hypothetical protein
MRETEYFGSVDGALRQWIVATIASQADTALAAQATIRARGAEVVTDLELAPGVREYRCYAPALWPAPGVDDAEFRLAANSEIVTSSLSVGRYRPWTIYLLSDGCTDYTWVFDNVNDVHAYDAAVTRAELDVAVERRGGPAADRNHYNMVVAREVEFFIEHYPDQAEQLFDAIREGTITLNPIYTMALTCDLSLEEMIRQLYPARAWSRDQQLDIGCANHQETPTIAWAMATVLAECGMNHLVKSILPYECPWAERLEEPPVFVWQGPDGSQVLVRWRNRDYVEGRIVLRDLRATNTALHDEIVPRYQALGDGYPFDAIALVGCYGDLAANSSELPAKKAATIAAYNAQGWDYPKLVNASHRQFWDAIDTQIRERDAQPPVISGDYGASWDAWPACMAYDFAQWRRAQERAGTADALAAIVSCIEPPVHVASQESLASGWMNLLYLADHAWNGSNDANRELNASLRREWQQKANDAFDAVVGDGLAALSRHVPTGRENSILVFNALGWDRTGVVTIPHTGRTLAMRDVGTGELVPSQVSSDGGESLLSFEARDVPSVGYRVYVPEEVAEGVGAAGDDWRQDANRLEGPFYSIEVSDVTGGIVSLYDKVRGRELIDRESPYHLNQCLYWSDGTEYTSQSATVEGIEVGPVLGQMVVVSSLKNTRVRTRITLYTGIDRVDIRNEVEKAPTSERQELDFAFPFLVPDRRIRFEAPGAIVEAGAEQRPGSGQAVTAVRHFVDMSNDEFGVTLSQADSGLVMFGHRTSQEDPRAPDPANSTVLALAMENVIDWHESMRDQVGVSRFVFRYSVRGHGPYDPVDAVRFGWEDNNEFLSVSLAPEQSGDLPAGAHSFVAASPDNAVLVCLKVAEEEGLIARLWECAGLETSATLQVKGLGAIIGAERTDPLEERGEPIPVTPDGARVALPGRGLATVRVVSK